MSTSALTGTHGYRCPKCGQNVSGFGYEGHGCLPSVKWLEGKFDALDRRLELIEEMLRRTDMTMSPVEAMMALGYWVTVLQVTP